MLIGNLEGTYKHLWVAPNSFKSKILEHIEDERQKALSGRYGRIIIKCNSLTDRDVIEKLAEASQCGVLILMNVRGICCLLPQLPGATENIRVVSIVGKFLEHTRLFCFGEGADMKLYLSSADLMTRNTVRRVEVACPILDPGIREKVLWMLDVMFEDDTNAWELYADGRYLLRSLKNENDPQSSQEIFIQEAQSRACLSQPENETFKKADTDPPVLSRITGRISHLFKRKSP
jgi:polyphosphate kinase